MNIFISGIAGSGLGPLAELMLDAGFKVRGSDLHPSSVSRKLEEMGVKISYDQSEEEIAETHREFPIDWLVYTSALPADASELIFARKKNIKFSKRDEFLSWFIHEKNLELISVAGTHGKTTTTSMLIWAFRELNIPLSYLVGADLPFASSGHYDKNSRFFVYETDEYDRNFLAFYPQLAVIPALDYDHPDIYLTPESYNEAFREFISQSNQTILWREAYEQLFANIKTDANLIVFDTENSDFQQFNLPGAAMRKNAYLVREVLRAILDDFDEAKITSILNRYPGAMRRFEKLHENLYTDYGHTPAEIAATMEKARELANKNGQKVVAIYQPHQNLRQVEIVREGSYKNVFAGVDKIYWVPTYLVRGDLVDGAPRVLTPVDLIKTLADDSRKAAEPVELNDELFAKIQRHLANGDLVLVMGAGTIDGWLRQKIGNINE